MESHLSDVLSNYECLLRLSSAGRDLLTREARPVRVPSSVFRQEGDRCDAVTLIGSGLVRVAKRRASGREILLYSFGPGEVCVLEALSALTDMPYRAEAVVERAVCGVAIPAAVLRRLVDQEPHLRAHLWRALEARLAMALELVGDVALGTLEMRLAGALLRHAAGTPAARVTHECLAHELACAREAVSRTLGVWERAGIVELGRAIVLVRDASRLAVIAEHAPEASTA